MLRHTASRATEQEIEVLVTGCQYFYSTQDQKPLDSPCSGFQTRPSDLTDTITFRSQSEAAIAFLQYRKCGIAATRRGKTLVISQ